MLILSYLTQKVNPVFEKTYNNNIVLVEDEKQLEMVLIGRGIAFHKKAGDPIDAPVFEKTCGITSTVLKIRHKKRGSNGCNVPR